MRFLMMALRGLGRLFGAGVVATVGFGAWLVRSAWEGWLQRSFAAEAAEREAAQSRADEAAEAEATLQARHEESALLAERQLAATEGLRDELRAAELARRAAARQPKAPEPVAPTTRWEPDDEPEPESGVPVPAYA